MLTKHSQSKDDILLFDTSSNDALGEAICGGFPSPKGLGPAMKPVNDPFYAKVQ